MKYIVKALLYLAICLLALSGCSGKLALDRTELIFTIYSERFLS